MSQIAYLEGEIKKLEDMVSDKEKQLTLLTEGIKIDKAALKVYTKGLEDMKKRHHAEPTTQE
jgi:hypothetical protein